ncbi:MAG: MarR family transcriptional regulator [Succinivibrionaceae bacterium]|nr:MarR family transcriptional regulator [Succinivibrionaceae bacterium]
MAGVARERGIVALASRLAEGGRDLIRQELQGAGLTDILPCHGDILHVCMAQPGLGITEIARQCGRSKSTVSAMVDKLCGLGYLSKEADADDPRAARVVPTRRSIAAGAALQAISARLNERLGAGMSEAELDALESLLGRAVRNLRP